MSSQNQAMTGYASAPSTNSQVTKMIIKVSAFLIFTLITSTSGQLSNATEKLFSSDLTYDELDSLELTCNALDSCQRNRTDDLYLYNCHCGSNCAVLDTCCVDSEFRSTSNEAYRPDIKCLPVYGERSLDVYMVNSCGPSANDFARGMCRGDAETKNDPFLLLPVTSPSTGISYKNYFCAECNGDTVQSPPVFWNLKLKGKFEFQSNTTPPSLTFDSLLRSWTVPKEFGNGSSSPVSLSFEVPETLKPLVKRCRPGIVSKCPGTWTDDVITDKCHAYMAIVLFERNDTVVRYRNPHCAICNGEEDAADFKCSEVAHQRAKPAPIHSTLFVGLFSFDERTKQCKGDMVYDRLAKKCRVLRN